MRKRHRDSAVHKDHDLIRQARAGHPHNGWKTAFGILALVRGTGLRHAGIREGHKSHTRVGARRRRGSIGASRPQTREPMYQSRHSRTPTL